MARVTSFRVRSSAFESAPTHCLDGAGDLPVQSSDSPESSTQFFEPPPEHTYICYSPWERVFTRSEG
jgi:hypothetical protein